jgi:hypothetical protein
MPWRSRLRAILTLGLSVLFLFLITFITRTTFVLPPLLATAATKYRDPEWRFSRSISVIVAYTVSGAIAVGLVELGASGTGLALLGSLTSFIIISALGVDHPPSILATFLGILERAGPLYIVHPVLTGAVIVETINYGITKVIPGT